MRGDIARAFFAAVVDQPHRATHFSDEPFSVDGTVVEAWAGQKSFRAKEDPGRGSPNGEGDLRGRRRSDETLDDKVATCEPS